MKPKRLRQKTSQHDSSPEAKMRRTQLVDRYYSIPTTAIRELVRENAVEAYHSIPKREIQATEESEKTLFQVNEEFEVNVCKYCDEICTTKHQLAIHHSREHNLSKTKKKKIGKPRNHKKYGFPKSKGKHKKKEKQAKELEIELNKTLEPARGSKPKQKFLMNYMKQMEDEKFDSQHGKKQTISLKGLSHQKGNVVKILNKQNKGLNLRDFHISVNDIEITRKIKCKKVTDKTSNTVATNDKEKWTLNQISKSHTIKQPLKKSEVQLVEEENLETRQRDNDREDYEGISEKETSNTKSSCSEKVVEIKSMHISRRRPQGVNCETEDELTNPEIHVADEKQKELILSSGVSSTIDKMSEWQKNREHIMATLLKIRSLKEKLQMKNDKAELQNTLKSASTAVFMVNEESEANHPNNITEKAYKPAAIHEESDEETDNTRNASTFDDIKIENGNLDRESGIEANELCNTIKHGEIEIPLKESVFQDNVISVTTEFDLLKKEQPGNASRSTDTVIGAIQERSEWKNSISACLTRLQKIKETKPVEKTKCSKLHQNETEDHLNNVRKLPDSNDLAEYNTIFDNNDQENTEKHMQTVIVKPSYLLENDHIITRKLNEHYRWLNLQNFIISVEKCAVPMEIFRNCAGTILENTVPKKLEVPKGFYLNDTDTSDIVKKWRDTIKQKLGSSKMFLLNEKSDTNSENNACEVLDIRQKTDHLLETTDTGNMIQEPQNELVWADTSENEESEIANTQDDGTNSENNACEVLDISKETDHLLETTDIGNIIHEPQIEFVWVDTSENEAGEIEITQDDGTNSENNACEVLDISKETDHLLEITDTGNIIHKPQIEFVWANTSENEGSEIADAQDDGTDFKDIADIDTERAMQLKNWRKHITEASLKLQRIKVNAPEIDKSNIVDVKPHLNLDRGIETQKPQINDIPTQTSRTEQQTTENGIAHRIIEEISPFLTLKQSSMCYPSQIEKNKMVTDLHKADHISNQKLPTETLISEENQKTKDFLTLEVVENQNHIVKNISNELSKSGSEFLTKLEPLGSSVNASQKRVSKKAKKKKSKSYVTSNTTNYSASDKSNVNTVNCFALNSEVLNQTDNRVPCTTIDVMEHNLPLEANEQENKAHCSKNVAKQCKMRKKVQNITVMNEAERLARNVGQLSRCLTLLRQIEDSQKTGKYRDSLNMPTEQNGTVEIAPEQSDVVDITKTFSEVSHQSQSLLEKEPNLKANEGIKFDKGQNRNESIIIESHIILKTHTLLKENCSKSNMEVPNFPRVEKITDITSSIATESSTKKISVNNYMKPVFRNNRKDENKEAVPVSETSKIEERKMWKDHISSTLKRVRQIQEKCLKHLKDTKMDVTKQIEPDLPSNKC